jgi:putative ABC transport system permease protein
MSLLWRLAYRNLIRQRRRNLATGLAMAAGYLGLLLFASYLYRSEHYLRVNAIYINNSGHLSIYKKGGLENFLARPREYLIDGERAAKLREVLQARSEIEFFGETLKGVGLIGNGCQSFPFQGSGVELEVDRRLRSHPQVLKWTPELVHLNQGRPIHAYLGTEFRPVAVTPGLLRKLAKTRLGETVPFDAAAPMPDCANAADLKRLSGETAVQLIGLSHAGDLSVVDGDLVGEYSTGLALSEDTGLLTSLEQMRALLGTEGTTFFSVFLKEGSSVDEVRRELQAQVDAAGLELEVHTYDKEEISLFYVGVMFFLYTMGTFFLLLVLGVITVSVVNFVTISTFERSSELGMMRALGFRLSDIARVFVCEVLLLTGASLVVGGVATFLLCSVVNAIDLRFHPPGIAGTMQFLLLLHVSFIVGCALLLLGLAVVTAWISTRIRMRQGIPNLLEAKQ